MNACGSCLYWRCHNPYDTVKTGMDTGKCVRFPPKSPLSWPVTHRLDECGEFKLYHHPALRGTGVLHGICDQENETPCGQQRDVMIMETLDNSKITCQRCITALIEGVQ